MHAGVAQPGRRTGLRNRTVGVRLPPPAPWLRSSADSEHRASTPGAEVRILSGALVTPRHRGRAARHAPAKRATAVRFRPVSFSRTQWKEQKMGTIKTFGAVDQRSLAQLKRCMEAGDAEFGVLCADHHPGYSQPIGGAIAYEDYVSPSGSGYDIGCGNKAARTELTRADLEALGGVESIMREITRRISFGMGVPAQERVDHPVLGKIRDAEFA